MAPEFWRHLKFSSGKPKHLDVALDTIFWVMNGYSFTCKKYSCAHDMRRWAYFYPKKARILNTRKTVTYFMTGKTAEVREKENWQRVQEHIEKRRQQQALNKN